MIGYCMVCNETFFYKEDRKYIRCPYCGSGTIKKNWRR